MVLSEEDVVMDCGERFARISVRTGETIGPCALNGCTGTIVEQVVSIRPPGGEAYDAFSARCTSGCGCRFGMADAATWQAAADAVGYSLTQGRFIQAANHTQDCADPVCEGECAATGDRGIPYDDPYLADGIIGGSTNEPWN